MQLRNGSGSVLLHSNDHYCVSISQLDSNKNENGLCTTLTKQLANVENKKIFCTYDIILRVKGSLCPQLSKCVHGLEIEKH